MPYKIKINTHDAKSCAAAEHDTCHCRCQGKLHGQSHKRFQQAESDFFDEARAAGEKEIGDLKYACFLNSFLKGKLTSKGKNGAKPSSKTAV